jgi:hypothetical protein
MTRSQRTLVRSLLAFVLALVTYLALLFNAGEGSPLFSWIVFLLCPYLVLAALLFAPDNAFATFLVLPMIAAEIFLYVAVVRRTRIRGKPSRALIWLIAVHAFAIVVTLAVGWVSFWRHPM